MTYLVIMCGNFRFIERVHCYRFHLVQYFTKLKLVVNLEWSNDTVHDFINLSFVHEVGSCSEAYMNCHEILCYRGIKGVGGVSTLLVNM